MSEYKHTQIGHVIIWSLLVVAVLGAIKATFELGPHRELLLVGIVLLITLALFYKLTITIDDEILRASLGIGVIQKRCRYRTPPYANPFTFAGGTAGEFI